LSLTENRMGMLVSVVILVVIAAVVYPLLGDRVDNLTNESHDDYVGADSEGIVAMIPLFYWLAVALTVIGVAIIAIKDSV
jgi:hypothetical protein